MSQYLRRPKVIVTQRAHLMRLTGCDGLMWQLYLNRPLGTAAELLESASIHVPLTNL